MESRIRVRICFQNPEFEYRVPLSYSVASKLLQRSLCLELIQNRKGVEPTASDQKRKIEGLRAVGRDHRPSSRKICSYSELQQNPFLRSADSSL